MTLSVQPLPTDKTLDRLVLRQPQLVIKLGRMTISVLRPLPEFARIVRAGEEGLVLLALVLEDRLALFVNFVRRKRDGHLDLVDPPLLPRAAVQPDLALPDPRPLLQFFQRLEDRRQADAVGAVRV